MHKFAAATVSKIVCWKAHRMFSSKGRLIKMTEKGQALHLQKLLSQLKDDRGHLYTQLNVIDTIINSEEYDIERASGEHDLFLDLYRRFQVTHGKYEVLLSDEDRPTFDKDTSKVEEEVTAISELFKQWRHSRRAESTKSKSRSSKSKSRSSKSSKSSLSAKAAEERARLAELMVDNQYQQNLDRKKLEYDQLQRDAKIAKSKALLQAYESGIDDQIGMDEALKNLPKQNQFSFIRKFVNQIPQDAAIPEEDDPPVPPSTTSSTANLQTSNDSPLVTTSTTGMMSSNFHNQGFVYPNGSTYPIPSNSGTLSSTQPPQMVYSSTLPKATQQSSHPNTHSWDPATLVTSTQPYTFHPINQVHPSPFEQKTLFTVPNHIEAKPSTSSQELVSIVNEMRAPNVVIERFSGNAMDFPFFITSFEEAVEKKVPDEKTRLQHLMSHVEGTAKELVESCIYLPSSECYQRAKQLLKERYGNPYIVNAEYRRQLTSWTKLKPNDVASFISFENFLIKYQSSMRAIGRESDGSIELLQLLQSKLPSYLQDRWSRKAYQIRKELKREATIDDFIKRFHEETEIISDPLFSRDAITEAYKDNNRDSSKRNPRARSFGIGAKEVVCACCGKKNHVLEKCFKFNKLNPSERKNLVFKSRLCFRCLQPVTDSHRGKTCKKPKRCTVCNQPHPTCLHQDKPSSNNDQRTPEVSQQPDDGPSSPVTSAFVNQSNDVGLCIVMVKVNHPDLPNKSVTTLALLDNGSQGTFVSDELIKELGIKGSNTCLEIQTVNGKSYQACKSITGLKVSPINSNNVTIHLPKSFSRSVIPVEPEDVPTASKLASWKYLHPILQYLPPDRSNAKVGILIGSNCPRALEPLCVIQSQGGGPYATKTKLGWCVTGPMGSQANQRPINCNRVNVKSNDSSRYFNFKETIKDVSIREGMLAMYNLDFHEVSNQLGLSIDDERFLKIMSSGKHINNRFHLPLPLRNPDKIVPNNRSQVLQRAYWFKKKMINNPKLLDDYTNFMTSLIDRGHIKIAEKAPTPNRTWYIPHFAVYHPKKPDKVRIVFDCSAEYHNYCLNKELLQGPDMTNQLIGVLTRFRQGPVAVMADIEIMFHQVCVEEGCHDYLRFVGWPDCDITKEPVDFQIVVHLQGASSSPSCANYALRETAKMYQGQFGEEASNTLIRNFYVDDMLKSFLNTQKAIGTIPNIVKMSNAGGFKLTKFHSNDRDVLATIPEEEKSKRLKNLDMSSNPIPEERALGMNWDPESDKFFFKIELKERPTTRRGVLSTISSIYDPLGIVSPYLLEGKKLLQQICVEKGWDDPLSPTQSQQWEQWKKEIKLLEKVIVDRCFHPSGFGQIVDSSLHHFSDASCEAYGQASYIRLINTAGNISIKLVMSKSRVAPPKRPTIPRLELTAAVLSVKIANSLHNELDILITNEYFWTDSQVVLAYISNEVKRFHLFVSNRIKFIRENSALDQWLYVPSKENPSDDTTRGLKFNDTAKDKRWIHGPEFLYKPIEEWPAQPATLKIENDDKEVKRVKCNAVMTMTEHILSTLEQHTSKWHKIKRIVATMLNWRHKLKSPKLIIMVEDLERAERAIVRLAQCRAYQEEIATLESNAPLKKSSQLINLAPFLDSNNLLRVGGRIRNADIPFETKHPIILPRKCITTNLIIEHLHQNIHHAGRTSTLNEVRRCGYWIINGNSLVRYILMKCVQCRILRGRSSTPKMADLPKDRLEPSPPFTYCGLDMFGPFIIRERRSDLKRYGIIFTCLNSRAVHLESVCSMDTDSFILCMRRFICRRGSVRTIRCDNGTNFVGANNELQKALQEMDTEKIKDHLLRYGTDFIINWIHNPPYASNFGGVWERLIRSARAILDGLMLTHGHSLNDESFRTFLVEVEGIINSRPLTTDGLGDPECPNILSPINLLTMKSNVISPPPGVFQRADIYCRRRWRRVQHLSNEFWSRWRKEFLSHLQSRSKWTNSKRNMKEGDVVLLKDDSYRNEWKRAVVTKAHESDDGVVRSVTIRLNNETEYVRPANKLVVLVECD